MQVRASTRSCTSLVIAAAVLLAWVPGPARAGGVTGARLDGQVVGVDGRPAAGHTVFLIDEQGAARQATTSSSGMYSFDDVAAGVYSLGVATPAGAIAPATAPPFRVEAGRLVRRDLKLLEADAPTVARAATANYGVGTWWGSLGGGGKAGVLVAIVAVGWGVYEAIDDERCASPPCD